MKKIVFALGVMSMMAIISCKKDTTVPPPPPPEPVAAPAPPPVPAAPEVEEEDGTSVSIGKDGLDVSTKDGDKKTTVKVSGEDSKIEIKK
ncbi:hypothetical protein J2X31_001555 [Flavobacterium arsenatis]|uniref:Uncharacterized protein n=1 Tax=Flavobacterium arsenatis TaxID=1484332 RepID=A0ABU1TNK4_9FLAO|nr:hypothetical protein [Flavobacterium arsenatis]MDR6967544.1 hypothetical protein [Flavobacterium arsenatis]